jgi:cytochrome P450
LRKSVQPVVAPKNLPNFESLIRARVCEILDHLPVGTPFNWVDAVSINLTTQMLATLFDFPFEERSKLTLWSDAFTAGVPRRDVEARKAREDTMLECLHRFQELWHQRKANPTGGFDLLTLMQQDPTTENLVERPMEYLGNLSLLIVGGNDTTRNSITGGVLALNQNPDQYAKLRADHSLVDSMVPEIIRWQTPLTHMRRTALEDVELGGQTIRKGDKVVMWYISGNRDESVIERADDFIIDRTNPRHHVSFGFGIHRCMGNRLAEMQLRILWEEILKRFDNVEVVGPVQRVHSNFVRGYTDLPVVLHPRH